MALATTETLAHQTDQISGMKGDVEGIDNQLKRSEQVFFLSPLSRVVDSDVPGSHDDGQDHYGSNLLFGGTNRCGSGPLQHLRKEEHADGLVLQRQSMTTRGANNTSIFGYGDEGIGKAVVCVS